MPFLVAGTNSLLICVIIWIWSGMKPTQYIPGSWKGQRIYLRVGDATYAAKIWINGKPLGQHEGCHLPFAFEISSLVNWNASNRISIQVENLLKPNRVPPRNLGGRVSGSFPPASYDFFPYAGLNRAVWLYTVPKVASIKDITIKTNFESTTGIVEVKVEKEGNVKSGMVIIAREGQKVEVPISFSGEAGIATVKIPNIRL